jgi:hypothetical protein
MAGQIGAADLGRMIVIIRDVCIRIVLDKDIYDGYVTSTCIEDIIFRIVLNKRDVSG